MFWCGVIAGCGIVLVLSRYVLGLSVVVVVFVAALLVLIVAMSESWCLVVGGVAAAI